MPAKTAPLKPGKIYHIYNRGINGQNIFFEPRNYSSFMALYVKHISPIASTYAYCLLPDHFHFLVRIRIHADPTLPPPNIAYQLAYLLTSYTKAINETYQRIGSLFQGKSVRQEIASDSLPHLLVTYIHHNPQKHQFIDDFRQWPYSSYQSLTEEATLHLDRDEVLNWFGGMSILMKMHETPLVNPALEARLEEIPA